MFLLLLGVYYVGCDFSNMTDNAPRDDARVRPRALDLPLFTWDDTSTSISAQDFLIRVDYARSIGDWSDEKTAQLVMLALAGKARAWANTLIVSESEEIVKWSTFRPVFKRRWHRTATICEKVGLRQSLKQKDTESMLDFLDRCTAAEDVFMDGLHVPEAQKAIFQVFCSNDIMLNFVAGLRPAIQERVIDAGGATLADIRDSAVRAENAVVARRQAAKTRGSEVALLDQGESSPPESDSELTAEEVRDAVMMLRARRRVPFKTNRSSVPPAGGPPSGNPRRPLRPIDCWFCEKIGHRQVDCFKRQKEGAPLLLGPRNKNIGRGRQEVKEVCQEPAPASNVYTLF